MSKPDLFSMESSSLINPDLIFLHANGYPPEAYQQMLVLLQDNYNITLPHLRPFWEGTNPRDLENWTTFRDDYLADLEQGSLSHLKKPLVGGGHSLGGMVSLLAALKKPVYFQALVLIEPVIFSPLRGLIFRLLRRLNLISTALPLIQRTLARKDTFSDMEQMFSNYRRRSVFRNIPDAVLRDYCRGLAGKDPDGSLKLRYPPTWEAQVYRTSASADRLVWKQIHQIRCPVLVLRGEHSTTLSARTADLLAGGSEQIERVEIPGTGHLVPFEKPLQTAGQIRLFLEQEVG